MKSRVHCSDRVDSSSTIIATITINGVTYTGNHVSVRGGRVLVDGKNVSAGEATRITLEVRTATFRRFRRTTAIRSRFTARSASCRPYRAT